MRKQDTTPDRKPSVRKNPTNLTRVEERGGSVNPAPASDVHSNRKGPIEKREEALDDALDDTFPGSDPVSITPEAPDKPNKR